MAHLHACGIHLPPLAVRNAVVVEVRSNRVAARGNRKKLGSTAAVASAKGRAKGLLLQATSTGR